MAADSPVGVPQTTSGQAGSPMRERNAAADVRSPASARFRLTGASLAGATVGFATADWGSRVAGSSVFPGGPLDETAHLLTTLIVLWALGPGPCRRFMVPAVVASVAIDVDHIPGELGSDWLTAGTPRPYTHSLLTVTVVLAAAALLRHRRELLFGVALGLTLHLWRDTSEAGNGVPLFWPLTYRAVRLSHTGYLVAMALVVGVAVWRLRVRVQ